ncbi:hypothetical protein HG535_0G05220 [Zygotorulaspora mrakii]|uniref:Ketoreductase (KR) domain-containing protein n=1 Tax=Zygotorulaspora mrakii TaxID=42260 RepID=A0A7H9B9E8_ZYGMR|nr:uncharacterized protein HG535_0G05220 [Zygotorulaspora mrakii]QLG74639.1 hypothetical protein HG535_0G05220 [Zygotorulaspora mrakii]
MFKPVSRPRKSCKRKGEKDGSIAQQLFCPFTFCVVSPHDNRFFFICYPLLVLISRDSRLRLEAPSVMKKNTGLDIDTCRCIYGDINIQKYELKVFAVLKYSLLVEQFICKFMSQKTSPKIALVTGSNGGIGKALVEEFHRREYKVYATDLLFATETKSELELKDVICLLMDVTSEEDVRRVSKQVALENNGRLDFLYCNAGRVEVALAADLIDEQIKSLYELNLFANMRLVRHFVRPLINSKGTIAFSGSVTKDVPFLGNSLYSSSKAALDEYAFVLHSELRNYGVKVIDVIGGYIKTPIFESRGPKIPPGSIYDFPKFKNLFDNRRERMQSSIERAMEPKVFARRTLDKIEKADISIFRIHEGYKSGTIHLLCKWLPSNKLVDYFLKSLQLDFNYRDHLKDDKV